MRDYRWTIVLAVCSVGFVLFSAAQRDSFSTVWGDESTFLAMAESLASEGDLRFDERDVQRLANVEDPRRSTVILQRTGDSIAYSKPIAYALLTAPGTLLAGRFGLILTNVALLAVALWSAWPFLCRLGPRPRAALTLATFVGASVLLAHVGWLMSDLMQAALSLSGLALALTILRRHEGEAATWLERGSSAWLAGVLLGALISARLPNVLIVATAVGVLVIGGLWGRALRVAGGAAACFLALALLSQWLVGSTNPYRAERSSFDATSGFPVSATVEVAERFETHRTTQAMKVKPRLQPSVSAFSTLYFVIGRHSGLLWYFPAALALLTTCILRPDRISLALLLGALGACAFYLIWWPNNYFGGSTFLGNRYFLAVYPLLLLALPRLPGRFSLAASWTVALAVASSAAVSLVSPANSAAASQSHARAGVLAWAPYESTGRNIDGRRDRFWSRDLLRFIEPAAGAQRDAVVLEAGGPQMEFMLTTRREDAPLLLRYRARTPGLVLRVDSGGETERIALDSGGAAPRGVINVPLHKAWRRHAYWWSYVELYSTRHVRLSLEGRDPEAKARFWYGGDPQHLDKSYDYKAQVAQLPDTATAGMQHSVGLFVRNMSSIPWAADGPFPVQVAYRLWPLDAPDAAPIEGPRVSLPTELPSGDPVNLALPITWPDSPGRYRLTIDLLIEGYDWFESRLGRPVASRDVIVQAAGS